jgi:hypothetical protein
LSVASNSSNDIAPLRISPLIKKVGVASTFRTSKANFLIGGELVEQRLILLAALDHANALWRSRRVIMAGMRRRGYATPQLSPKIPCRSATRVACRLRRGPVMQRRGRRRTGADQNRGV